MRFIPSTWLHRPQVNRLPGSLCDEAPMVADGPTEAAWTYAEAAEHARSHNAAFEAEISSPVAGKWQPRIDGDVLELRVPSETIRAVRQHLSTAPAGPDTEDDMPPMLLLARMRQRLDVVRQALLEVTNDRDTLNEANGRLVDQRDAARDEAEALRTALAHVGRELEQQHALTATLTRQVNALNPAGMAMHAADDELFLQPLPAQD